MAGSVKVLNLSKNMLSLQGAEHLADLTTKMRALKELYLAECSLGDRGTRAILEKLDQGNIALDSLDLSGNLIG